MNRPTLALAATALIALAGCAGLTPADRARRTDPVARLTATGPSPWTADLGDPVLADLLREADLGALDIKAALARLEHADAEAEAAAALGRPSVTAGIAGAVGDQNFQGARSAATPTLEATYDLDLFGRYARGRDAAGAERRAAAWDVEAVRLLVGAETVRAYIALRAAQDAVEADARGQALAQTTFELAQIRADQGVMTAEALDQRRRALAAAAGQADIAHAEAEMRTARLADLTGQHDLTLSAGSLPRVGPREAPPSDTVDRRPDVQAAFARLAAADQRRAAAVAASRPTVQIAAALGAPDAAIATLLDVRALAWAVAATSLQQVSDGGARRADVHLASADADQADIAYRQAVVAGWSEMRAAQIAETVTERQTATAEQALEAARTALTIGEARRDQGVADGLAIADLQAQVELALEQLRAARVSAAETRVRQILAAGGR